jgi:hypothetical protein
VGKLEVAFSVARPNSPIVKLLRFKNGNDITLTYGDYGYVSKDIALAGTG